MNKQIKTKKKGWEDVFLKKVFHSENFTWGLMIKSCKGGGKISQMHFPII